MFFIEVNGPGGVGPGADEDWAICELPQMGQKLCADAALLSAGENVGVANESDVADVLNAHYAGKMAAVFVTRESYAFVDFVLELVCGHVRLGPAVGGDDAFVGLSAVVDDGVNAIEVLSGATSDHERCVSPAGVQGCCANFWR